MGARSGSGSSGGGGRMVSLTDLRGAQKAVSAAKAGITKAQKNLDKAWGGYYMAQGSANKVKASAKISQMQQALTKAQSNYDTINSVFNAKLNAFNSGKKFNPGNIDLPF